MHVMRRGVRRYQLSYCDSVRSIQSVVSNACAAGTTNTVGDDASGSDTVCAAASSAYLSTLGIVLISVSASIGLVACFGAAYYYRDALRRRWKGSRNKIERSDSDKRGDGKDAGAV